MLLILHIFIALTSLAATTFLYFAPSERGLRVSYGLIAGTLLSGTLLIITTRSHLIEACLMGLIYTGIVTVITLGTRRRLADIKVRFKR